MQLKVNNEMCPDRDPIYKIHNLSLLMTRDEHLMMFYRYHYISLINYITQEATM